MLCLGKFKVLGKFNFYLGASLFSKGSATKWSLFFNSFGETNRYSNSSLKWRLLYWLRHLMDKCVSFNFDWILHSKSISLHVQNQFRFCAVLSNHPVLATRCTLSARLMVIKRENSMCFSQYKPYHYIQWILILT
jgi:hypothetical protein